MRAALAIVSAVVALALLIWVVAPKPIAAPASPAQHFPAAVLPLYPGASWGWEEATREGGAVDYTISSAPFTNITDIASATAPFMSYYDQKLGAAGWSVDTAREASGPGAQITPYIKNGQELIVSYSTVFKNNPAGEPAQCPCDTTLGLESVGP